MSIRTSLLIRSVVILGALGCQVINVAAQIGFAPHQQYSPAINTRAVGIGNFNGDGIDDAVILDNSGTQLYFHYGTGNGFTTTPYTHTYEAFSGTNTMCAGDLNNDGLDDIVLEAGGYVGVILQNTDHTFAPVVTLPGESGVWGLTVGDLNNDNRADIVVLPFNTSFLTVFYQIDGGFDQQNYTRPNTGGFAQVDIGDLNGDGRNDLLYLQGGYPMSVNVFIQDDQGDLDPYVTYTPNDPGLWSSDGAAIGDLNDDGLNDIVASKSTNTPDARVFIWLQDPGTHTFPSNIAIPAFDIPSNLLVADLDCDGDQEIIVGHSGWEAFSVYTQDDAGVYFDYQLFDVPYTSYGPLSMAVMPVTADEREDLVLANGQAGLLVCPNTSLPVEYNTAFISSSIDTVFTGTEEELDGYGTWSIDTVNWAIIYTENWYEITTTWRHDSVRTDTTLLLTGEICGGAFADTVHHLHTAFFEQLLGVDTVLAFTYTDTLNVGVPDRSHRVSIAAFPNPVQGILTCSGGVAAEMLGCPFEVAAANAMCVKRGTIGVWPFELDVAELPAGTYYLRITSRHGPVVIPLVIVPPR